MREVRRHVPVIRHVTALSAEGEGRLSSVRWRCASGQTGELAAQNLLLHQGVVPQTNLAMSVGVSHRWDDEQLCWLPELDAYGRSSVAGIFLAGDNAGIGGGWLARERGRLAAIAAIRDLVGPLSAVASDASEREVRRAAGAHQLGRAFLDRYFAATETFRIPEGNTVVCRCEEVSADQVREAVRLGCEGPNQMKAFLRCGMGACQGRLCNLTVTELIARERRVPPQEVGTYRVRPPVKPIRLSALAALSNDDSAVKAVVRG